MSTPRILQIVNADKHKIFNLGTLHKLRGILPLCYLFLPIRVYRRLSAAITSILRQVNRPEPNLPSSHQFTDKLKLNQLEKANTINKMLRRKSIREPARRRRLPMRVERPDMPKDGVAKG